jgi:hypothetical protein
MSRLRRALAPLALLLAACAHRDPPPVSTSPGRPTSDPLAPVRAGVEAVLRSQAEGYWRAFTAGEQADPAAAWRGREALLSPETLAALDAALGHAQGDERRALEYLRAFLLGEAIARDVAEASAKLAAARASSTLAWDGRQIPARQVPSLLAAEPDALRRKALAAAAVAAARRWIPLADAWRDRIAAAARARGFAGTLALARAVRGEDPETLAALATAVLDQTDATYRALLDDLARRDLWLSLATLRARDLPRLLRSQADLTLFPADRQLGAAAEILAGFGLDLAGEKRLVIDGAVRPGKVGRPVALPVDVPGGVRVSFAPVPGLEALRALLDALGVAEGYVHVHARPMEFRRLGPEALPRAWGGLLESITCDPGWLEERGLRGEALRAEVRRAAAHALHRIREDAAVVIFEVARAKQPARASELWPPIAERAFGHPEEEDAVPPWRTDPDPLLRAAEDLRGRLLAAAAAAALEREGGVPWWRAPRAAHALRRVWAEGSRPGPDGAARALGAPGLDPAAVDALLRARLERVKAAP